MRTLVAFTAALSAFSQLVLAQTQDQKDKYPRWSTEMDLNGYTWEPFEVTTEDGYILTLFHITGTVDGGLFTPTQPPVLINHGHMEDASSWMNAYHEEKPSGYVGGKPMPCQLADAGYDVWMSNNRGTEYSQGHTTLSTDDREYWEFSWAQMGLYDDPANISFINTYSCHEKTFYVGYSQGTVQMHYGLSHIEESYLVDNVIKVVSLAPCFIASDEASLDFNKFAQMRDLGVYAIKGPNWDADLQTICDNFDIGTCLYFKTTDAQCYSVHDNLHWGYNNKQKRFQEWAPNYDEGDVITDLVPVESIDKVQIAMFSGTLDETCPHDRAEDYAAMIGADVVYFESYPGQDHGFWTYASDDHFISMLIAQLQVPGTESENEFLQ